ncbi:MAG: tetratricopeptide repeat protein [Myxococcota bacterium]
MNTVVCWMAMLLASAWGQEPWEAAAAKLARSPASTTARVQLGAQLATDASMEDEAMAVLMGLKALGHDEVQNALMTVLSERVPRAGWADLYDTLPAYEPVWLARDALAELQSSDRPRDGLNKLARLDPGDLDLDLALSLGREALRAGHVDDALRILLPWRDASAARDLASLAWWIDEVGMAASGADVDRPSGGPDEAALALVEAGLSDQARTVVSRMLAFKESVEGRVRLGRLVAADGEFSAAWEVLSELEASSQQRPDVAPLLVDILAAQGQFAEARVLAERTIPALLVRVEAFEQLQQAVRVDDEDRIALLTQVWATIPEAPGVARRIGLGLLDAGAVKAALQPLAAAVKAAPTDGVLLGRAINAAMQAGAPEQAIALAHDGLPSLAERSSYLGISEVLGWAWAAQGEHDKAEGALDKALAAYGVALAMLPDQGAVVRGAAGALWASGEPDAAFDAYRVAFVRDVGDVEALSALIELSFSLGREAEVRELMAPHMAREDIQERHRAFERRAEIYRVAAGLYGEDRGDAVAELERLEQGAWNDPEALRAIAGVWLSAEDPDRALQTYRQSLRAQPGNPWSELGVANSLIGLERFDDAEEALRRAAQGVQGPNEALRATTRASIVRGRGQQAQRMGQLDDAVRWFREARDIDPTPWSALALGNLYRDVGRVNLAEKQYRRALAVDAQHLPSRSALVMLLILEGKQDAARVGVDEAPRGQQTGLKDTFAAGKELRRSREAHLSGDLETALRVARDVMRAYPDVPEVRPWLRALELEYSPPPRIYEHALRWLQNDLTDLPALRALLGAAHAMRNTAEVLPTFEAAATRGGSALGDLHETARLVADAEAAVRLAARGQRIRARSTLVAREAAAADHADRWVTLGEAWLALGDGALALRAYDKAAALAPDLVAAQLGRSAVLSRRGQHGQARDVLVSTWAATRDAEVGLALAQDHIESRRGGDAREVLNGLKIRTTGTTTDVGDASMRPAPGVLNAGQLVRLGALKTRLRHLYIPQFSGGLAFHSRPGDAGRQRLSALALPVRVHDLGVGRVRFDLEAVPVLLADGQESAAGARLSVGMRGRMGAVSGWARLGVSELGFGGPAYPLWNGGVDLRLVDTVHVGAYTSRDAVTDSYTSWVGGRDASGAVFGRVHRTTLGGYVGATPTALDTLGMSFAGGWNMGQQMETVGYWEMSARGKHAFPFSLGEVAVGAAFLAMAFDEQRDGFEVGEGGFFSPELFFFGAAQVNGVVRSPDERWEGCVGAAAGPQVVVAESLDDDPLNYIGSGLFLGGAVHASLDWRATPFVRVGVDYGFQSTGSAWQAHTAALHVRVGPPLTVTSQPRTAFSRSAGAPWMQVQACGN